MLSDHSMEINPLVFEIYGMEELVGVVKHELCHYHLHIEGKGYRHRDADFRKLVKGNIFPKVLQAAYYKGNKSRVFLLYKCKSCGLEYKRKRRMDIRKYRCGKCAGAIVDARKMI